jgi:hypothetical protein
MPFPWYDAPIPEAVRATYNDRALDAVRREIEERASLLGRLGYSKQQAIARLRANMSWEFERMSSKAPLNDELEKLVDAAYQKL